MNKDDLKSILDDLNISQRKFARLVGVSPNAVNNWVRGKKNISKPVQKLAILLRERKELILFLEDHIDR